jgi:hypothetical protein
MRRKAQLDHDGAIGFARQQGHTMGSIFDYERFLRRPQTPTEQLIGLSLYDLTRLANDLEKEALSHQIEIANRK